MTALRFDMNNPADTAEDNLLAVRDDIGGVRHGLYVLELAAGSLNGRERNAFATTLYALSATLDELDERIGRLHRSHDGPAASPKAPEAPKGDDAAEASLRALIEERHRIYHSHISAYSPFPKSDEEMEPIVDAYEAAHMAWLAAPVPDLKCARLKAQYLLSDREMVENLRANHDELEVLLSSIAGWAL